MCLFIGDVRDKDRLYRALDGVDFVAMAAATKKDQFDDVTIALRRWPCGSSSL